MEIETKVVIGGHVVTEIFGKNDIIIYEKVSELSDQTILFFVKGNKVLFTQEITADCSQNHGYISGITFKGVN